MRVPIFRLMLVCLCGALAAQIWLANAEVTTGQRVAADDGEAAPSFEPLLDQRDADFEIDQFIARPVFNRSRRPVERVALAAPLEKADAEPAETQRTPPRPVLIGAIVSAEGGVALLRDSEGAILHARAGDSVDGWTVMTIEVEHVTLAHRQVEIDVSVREDLESADDEPAHLSAHDPKRPIRPRETRLAFTQSR
jgi:hypothetical protein